MKYVTVTSPREAEAWSAAEGAAIYPRPIEGTSACWAVEAWRDGAMVYGYIGCWTLLDAIRRAEQFLEMTIRGTA